MKERAWVCITTNKTGGDIKAVVSASPQKRPWARGRWLVASVYTGSVTIAKQVAAQVKALGPDADIAKAVAAMQA